VDPSRRAQHLRPPDLIYGLDERPPLAHLILLGAQHVAVICPYLVFITLIAQAAGATTAASNAVGLKLPLLLRSGVSGFTSTYL
jgi:xanthine/uracil permease